MSSEAEAVLYAEIADSCAAVERYLYIRICRTALYESIPRLCLVLALDSVAVLEQYALDTAVSDGLSVEDITYTEIVCELVLQALACGSSVCFELGLVALDKEIIKEEVLSGIVGELYLELVAALGSGISALELCPFACGNVLGSKLDCGLLSCFFVDSKK